jgi:hypothetical protein
LAQSGRKRILRATRAATPQSSEKKINQDKKKVGLGNVPSTYFTPGSTGGIFGIGLLKPRPNSTQDYTAITNSQGRNVYSNKTIAKFTYFFLKYDNIYTPIRDGKLYTFAVIITLSPQSINSVAMMLGKPIRNLTPLSLKQYEEGSFSHPTYVNQNGVPLTFRYAEIPVIVQKTPGRLDNVPLGYPNFDSTPSPISTSQGPLPSPPIVNFATATGATGGVTITAGGTVYFVDASVQTPSAYRPLGWIWDFGATASPTGSSSRSQIVTYGATGVYSVTLIAFNEGGTGSKTKPTFVTVI